MNQSFYYRRPLDTGSLALNRLTAGGIPSGTLFEIRGNSRTDLGYIALSLVPSAQALGLETVYLDCHGGVERSRYEPNLQAKFDLVKMGIKLKYLNVIHNLDGSNQRLEECISTIESHRSLMVIEDLSSIVLEHSYKTGDAQQAHNDIRRTLLKLAKAARQSGSFIIILNDPSRSNFRYTPPKGDPALKSREFELLPSMISGICQIQFTKLEKRDGEVTGSIQRARMIHGRSTKPYQSDVLHIDYRYGLSNLGTVVRVAQDQGLLQYDERLKHHSAPPLARFAPKPSIEALYDYLRLNVRAYRALIKAIDWSLTPYKAPKA